MTSSRRILLATLALGGLTLAVTGVSGQSGGTLTGVDVSVFQGGINWTTLRASGVSFVIIRAGHGTATPSSVDTNFAANWANAKAAGLVRGAYWFVTPQATPSLSQDAVGVANLFVKTVQPKEGDLQLCLDLENTGGLNATDLRTWVQAFCGQVQNLTHRPAVIYTGSFFWNDNLNSWTNNMNCALWLAQWTTNPAPSSMPAAWTTWTFWQYSSTGTGSTYGMSSTNVDLDRLNGGASTLQALSFPREPLQRK